MRIQVVESYFYMNYIKPIIETALEFVYPNLCFHCEGKINPSQKFLCFECWNKIKKYNPETDINHTLESRLKGKIKTQHIETLFWFQSTSPLQTLLHELKYNYQPKIGTYLGEFIGDLLIEKYGSNPEFTAIIPVPIHYLKKIERGYNQTERISEGIITKIPTIELLDNSVEKSNSTESQTKKGRFERWKNLTEGFSLNLKDFKLKNHSHILIIDDIITTGATIEALSKIILNEYSDLKISIATVALAE